MKKLICKSSAFGGYCIRVFARCLALVVCCTLFAVFTACSDSDYESPLSGRTVADLTFTSEVNTEYVTIDGIDMSQYSVTSSEEWCMAGVVDTQLAVSVFQNNTYSDRSATITITDDEDGTKLFFGVLQTQNNAIIVETTEYDIPMEGGTVVVPVDYNVDYDIVIPQYNEWLTYTSDIRTRALARETLTFVATRNNSAQERQAVVNLVNTTTGTTRQLTFNQKFAADMKLSSDAAVIGKEGGTVNIYVGANVYVTCSSDSEWCTLAGQATPTDSEVTSAIADYDYIYKFTINVAAAGDDIVSSRTATITLGNSYMDISRTFEILQLAE